MTGALGRAKIAGMSTEAFPARGGPPTTTLYFTVALTLCTLALLVPSLATLGVLAGPAENYMAAAPLAAFSPTIAAVIASWREGRWPAVRALFRGLRAWRVSPIWYVLALALPTMMFTVARAVYGLLPMDDGGAW